MRVAQIARRPWAGPLLALLLACAVFALLRPDAFARAENLSTMCRQTVVVALCAIGMTLVIIHGGIDLSVGSQVALSTVVVAWMLKAHAPPLVAAAAGVATVMASGAITGLLVGRLRMMPFIVTLGSMSVLRGLAKGIAREQKIDVDAAWLERLQEPGDGLFGVAPGVLFTVAVAVTAALALEYTRFGRHLFAVGSNEKTAVLCGVDAARLKLFVYVIAGLLTGLAGVMEFSTLTVGDPTDSVGLELEVIAAVVIGGASLSGGEGSILGSMIGALLMTVIRTGSVHVGLPNWVQEIVTGAIIVLAVGVDRLRPRSRIMQRAE